VSGFPAGETITVVRPGPVVDTDGYGNDVRGADVETDVAGCAVAPRTSTENVDARDQIIEGLTVWPPAGTDIQATDKIRRGGVLYEIDGDPGAWRSPFTGLAAPMRLSLTRVTG
jgi:hypothetical protein